MRPSRRRSPSSSRRRPRSARAKSAGPNSSSTSPRRTCADLNGGPAGADGRLDRCAPRARRTDSCPARPRRRRGRRLGAPDPRGRHPPQPLPPAGHGRPARARRLRTTGQPDGHRCRRAPDPGDRRDARPATAGRPTTWPASDRSASASSCPRPTRSRRSTSPSGSGPNAIAGWRPVRSRPGWPWAGPARGQARTSTRRSGSPTSGSRSTVAGRPDRGRQSSEAGGGLGSHIRTGRTLNGRDRPQPHTALLGDDRTGRPGARPFGYVAFSEARVIVGRHRPIWAVPLDPTRPGPPVSSGAYATQAKWPEPRQGVPIRRLVRQPPQVSGRPKPPPSAYARGAISAGDPQRTLGESRSRPCGRGQGATSASCPGRRSGGRSRLMAGRRPPPSCRASRRRR